ncbi:MAG: divalent-cation tolerance protein CutA [Candidatus Melainabacteria bacterium]|jgi:periplasmic divalent cation tolerance protein
MSQLSEFQIVYATCDQIYKAEEISRILLEKRLIACANIINNVKSLYWWNGSINESAEIIIIAKTKTSLIQSVIDEIKSIHNYSCPCIICLPILDISEDYAIWLNAQID